MDGVPRSLNVEYYARVIKEKAVLRRLILSSAKIIQDSYDEKMDADELLGEAQESIIDVAEQRIKQGFEPLGQLTQPALAIIEKHRGRNDPVTGVPSGFRDLDQLTLGFQPSELVIVAARPSMGKTALCLNIAQHVGLKTDYVRRLLLHGDVQGIAGHAHALRRRPGRHQGRPHGLPQRPGARAACA